MTNNYQSMNDYGEQQQANAMYIEEEFKINYARHNIWSMTPAKDPTPPEGWLSEEEAISTSGIDVRKFDQMIRSYYDSPGNEPRARYLINKSWVEFYKIDQRMAVNYLFHRFTSNLESNLMQLEHDLHQHFKAEKYAPSIKQLKVLEGLLDNQFLTAGERWLIELVTSDNLVTKEEVIQLLNRLIGYSTWDGRKWSKYDYGLLSERRRKAKI